MNFVDHKYSCRKAQKKRETDWTPFEEQALRDGWDAKLSGARIGLILGKTRCAVLGKARRMNLPMRGPSGGCGPHTVRKSSAPRLPRPKEPSAPSGVRIMPERKLKPRGKPTAPKYLPAAVPLTDKPPIGIMELDYSKCHAVVGRGSDGLAVYCGDDVFAGKPFCEGHCAMYYSYERRSA